MNIDEQYLSRRMEIGCKSVLGLGCGSSSHSYITSENNRRIQLTVTVETFVRNSLALLLQGASVAPIPFR